MKIATVHLKSTSPYSQSRNHDTPKLAQRGGGETPDAYEERTWRNRLHVNEDGFVFIPPMQFKNALSEVAKYLGIQIAGKGKSTYTKHIEAGVLVVDPLVLPVRAADVAGERLYLNADGKRGSGKRVWRTMPLIPSWEGPVTFTILDDIITQEVFLKHLREAGNFIGIGRWRPRNNGLYGRFSVEKLDWQEVGVTAAA